MDKTVPEAPVGSFILRELADFRKKKLMKKRMSQGVHKDACYDYISHPADCPSAYARDKPQKIENRCFLTFVFGIIYKSWAAGVLERNAVSTKHI